MVRAGAAPGAAGAHSGGRLANAALEEEEEEEDCWDAPEHDDPWDRKRRGKGRELARMRWAYDPAED